MSSAVLPSIPCSCRYCIPLFGFLLNLFRQKHGRSDACNWKPPSWNTWGYQRIPIENAAVHSIFRESSSNQWNSNKLLLNKHFTATISIKTINGLKSWKMMCLPTQISFSIGICTPGCTSTKEYYETSSTPLKMSLSSFLNTVAPQCSFLKEARASGLNLTFHYIRLRNNMVILFF